MALRKFRECYRHVFQLRQLFPTIPFTLVSASTTQNELEVLTKELKMHGTVIHVPARQSQYRLNFIADYIRNHPRQCGLVFVRTRAQAEKVAEKLQSLLKPDSVVVDYYHGRASHKLSSILDRWHRDQIDVVVCTCSFAEGIDKNNVRFVFHYHLPPTMAAYAQETGRAGRDGKPSHCILFHSFSDLSLAANIIAEKVDNQRFLSSSQREDLQQVINFSYDFLTCRRYHILAPFQVGNNRAQNGEQWLQNVLERQQGIPNCSLCDNCDDLQRKRKHFKHLSHQEIVQIENCFKSDMELPKHQLVSQVADNMNYSVLRAKEIVEFLAAAGVLKLEFCSQEGDQDDLRPMLSKSSRLIRDISWLPPPPAPDRITKSGVLKSVSNLASGPEKPIGGESTQEEFDSDTEGDANEESDEHQHDGIEAVKEMPVSDSSSYTRIRIPRRRFEESDSASPSDSAASPDFHPDDLGKPQKLVDEFRKVISKQTDVQRLHLTPEQLTGIIEAIIRETTRREDQYLDEDRLANIIERCTSSKGKKIQLLGVHISQRDICEHLIREVFAGFHVAKRVRQS
ncbi:ATP-dependent DNA helicase sgs1 [Serendipita sp. 399]|nr:ATP-dependent DNA helicase sgs1 [Serendipita sp. 399]